ncbi:FkbM family methyltransferase [Pseudoprimorskyibacter insulae]|nr:FkbM family methyltransferase [Pseudoprimorskyibacter insulae]
MTDYTEAANCLGVSVPESPFLNEMRIVRMNEGRYEGQEIAGAMKVVTSEDRVLEMGAGLGVVGGVIAKNCKPQEIRSFEANPALMPHINALYQANDLTGTISVQNTVLLAGPDQPASIPFFVRTSFLGSSLNRMEGKRNQEVMVPTLDFNAFCAGYMPTVLVIDIEGGELDILRHADLSGFRAIVIEFHPDHYGIPGMRECKRILGDAGFVKDDEVSSRTVWTCVKG